MFVSFDGVGVGVGVIVCVTEGITCVTSKSKSSHVKSEGEGVIEGVIVGVGVGDTGVDVTDGVTVADGLTDGDTLIDGVIVGVILLVGVGVGVTVHVGSPHVVVPVVKRSPIIMSVVLPYTPVKQFSGNPPEGIVRLDIVI